MSELAFREVWKSFGPNSVLRGLTVTLPLQGITFIVGRSGSGKSVLCRLAVGLLRPDRGEIVADGVPVHRAPERALISLRARLPYLVQGPALLDWLTVRENVLLAGRTLSAAEASRRCAEALERLGLGPFADRHPPALGPGLKKRVAIARALLLQPTSMLLDEPTTGLDRSSALQVREAIATLGERGVGAIVVSHDYEALEQLADRVIVVGRGQAVFDGTRDDFFRATHPEVLALRVAEAAYARPSDTERTSSEETW